MAQENGKKTFFIYNFWKKIMKNMRRSFCHFKPPGLTQFQIVAGTEWHPNWTAAKTSRADSLWLRRNKGTEIYSEATAWWHAVCQRTLLTTQLFPIDVWCRRAIWRLWRPWLKTKAGTNESFVKNSEAMTEFSLFIFAFPIYRIFFSLTNEGHIDVISPSNHVLFLQTLDSTQIETTPLF